MDEYNAETLNHHDKPENLHKAALQGCVICRALWCKLSISQQTRALSLNCSSDYPNLTSMSMIALPVLDANADELRKSGPETALIDVAFPVTTGNDLARHNDIEGLDHSIHMTNANFVLYPATSSSCFLATIWTLS